MPSPTYKQLVERQLGSRFKGQSQLARIEIFSEFKGVALNRMTFEVAAKYGMEEDSEVIEALDNAASRFVDNILDNITDSDLFKERKPYKKSTKDQIQISTPGLFRDKSGKFISAFNLQRLLNLTLYSYVAELMTEGSGRLVYRTGRLAHSGLITGIREGKNRNVSFYFRYMLAPYEVFENNPRMNPTGERSPIKLFSTAIYNALQDMLINYNTLNAKAFLNRGGR